MQTIYLLGAPTDIGASVRGASLGPDALRVANFTETLRQQGCVVTDAGNLNGPTNPWQPPMNGYRHLSEVVKWNQLVYSAIYPELSAGALPILLGGDHCLAMGSIAAVLAHCGRQQKKLRVLWLDAHADFNTAELTPSGNLHGMPVACLLGQGAPELLALIHQGRSERPYLRAEELVEIGIRSVDDGERRLVYEQGLTVFDMRSVDELGMRVVMQKALAGLDQNTHLHVSFDVDFLDASFAPGVGTPVDGGPTYREAQLCMEMIADTGRLASLDIMELNPALDTRNRTAELVVELVASLFGKSTLIRRTH